MSYLQVLDLQFDKYRLTTEFEENIIYGVLSDNDNVRSQFYKLLAGINNSKGSILYNNTNAFDNFEYFKNRLLIDFKNKYLKTLNINTINETIMTRFNRSFNAKEYKEAVGDTNLRREVTITNEYKFTELGITLSNYCLFKGLSYKYNIIDNPVINIHNSDLKKKLYSNLCLKQLNPIITIENLVIAKEYCDRLLVIGEFEDLSIIDLKKDTFMISSDNPILRQKIFKKEDLIISINTYTKEELKYLSKNKVKYKIINLNDLIKLFGGKNNEK